MDFDLFSNNLKIEFKTKFIGEIISYVPGNVFVKSRKDVANYNFLTTCIQHMEICMFITVKAMNGATKMQICSSL